MKTKPIFLLIFLFILAQGIFAQEKVINIECNLTINETEWQKNSQITATMTLRNNSDTEVKIYLPPNFILAKQDKKRKEGELIFGVEYTSRESEKDHIITKRTEYGYSYKIRQFFEFSLKANGSKTVEFDISKLVWNDSMSSILKDFAWYKLIPSGNYDLYYDWSYNLDENENLREIRIISNNILVKLNIEK